MVASKNKYQSVWLAPTEILANQHFENVSELLAPYKIKVGLMTAANKNANLEKDDLIIGTHALLQKDVEIPNLALIIALTGKKVLLVHGNHDGLVLGQFLSDFYKVKNLHAQHSIYYDVGFFGCGGANVGLDAMSEEEIFSTLKNGFRYVKNIKKKIAVTHVHPDGTIVEKIAPGFGSLGLKNFIEKYQPDFVLCGHVHEAAGIEDFIGKTKVINVGRNGKILEF